MGRREKESDKTITVMAKGKLCIMSLIHGETFSCCCRFNFPLPIFKPQVYLRVSNELSLGYNEELKLSIA